MQLSKRIGLTVFALSAVAALTYAVSDTSQSKSRSAVSGGQLTGGGGMTRVVTNARMTGSGTSGNPLDFATSGVTPGSYTSADVTIDTYGRVTSAANGGASIPPTRAINAGTGLTGGGDLSADRTISMANMPTLTVKGNNTGGSGPPLDLTASQTRTLLGLATIATSSSASDLTTGTLPGAQFPALTGPVTTSAGSLTTSVTNNAITNAMLAQMATNTIKGNNTGSTATPTDLTIAQAAALLGIGAGQFGDGSDGSVTFDGSTTVVGFTRSGSVYTSTRETHFRNVTVNSGVTLMVLGFPFNVRGTLTNNGHISGDGGNAVTSTAGTNATPSGSILPIGTNGGAGGTSGNGGTAGTSGNAPRDCSTTAAAGGNPGVTGGTCHGGGGGATLALGGSGGTIVAMILSNGIPDWRSEYIVLTGQTTSKTGTTLIYYTGSTGGGGGGFGNGTGVGGGGGAAGSWIVLRIYAFASGTTGTITSIGGNGANGTASSGTNQNGSGGGGGGGGGIIVLKTVDQNPPITSASASTVCAGGSAGAGGAGTGTGNTGGAGGPGGAGLVVLLN